MDERVWNEMSQAKENEIYMSLYSIRQKKLLNYYNVFITISAFLGTLSWKSFEYGPVIGSSVVVIASLLKQVQQFIIFDENKLSKLVTIQNFYAKYFNKLEALWEELCNSRISDEEAAKAFYIIKDTENEINLVVNEVIVYRPKSLQKEASEAKGNYLQSIHC